jgi:predicted amidohydrolase YtcJ
MKEEVTMAAKIMKKAWEIAREGQKKFGGKVKEYFAQALRIAWAIAKGAMKEMKKYTINESGKLVGMDYATYQNMSEKEKTELKSSFRYVGEGQWFAKDVEKHELVLSSNLMEMIERRIEDKERAFKVVARRIDSIALPELKEKAMELLRNTVENWEKNEQQRIDSIINQMKEKFGITAVFKKKKEHGYDFETSDGEYVHVTYRDPYTEDGHVTVGFNDIGQVAII